MRKIILIFILLIAIASCTSTHKTSSVSSTNNWSKEPSIENVKYEGGDGKSPETAIKIKNAVNERNGVAAEYAYIGGKFGVKFVDWKPIGQSTLNEANRKIDLSKIQLIPKEEVISFYFDITEFYGKF